MVQNLERSISQQQGEVDHLQDQLRDFRQQAEAEKEALKKATRAQKQRAQRSEDTVGQLSTQLMEIVSGMSLIHTASHSRFLKLQFALIHVSNSSILLKTIVSDITSG